MVYITFIAWFNYFITFTSIKYIFLSLTLFSYISCTIVHNSNICKHRYFIKLLQTKFYSQATTKFK